MTQRREILIAEDDADIAYVVGFILQREGYAVRTVADGRAAAAAIDGPPPVLAILDVMLPYVDGFALLSRIRSTPAWAGVPVIMLTAKSQEKNIVRALDLGASDYVLKPFQPDELLARIRRLLGKAAA